MHATECNATQCNAMHGSLTVCSVVLIRLHLSFSRYCTRLKPSSIGPSNIEAFMFRLVVNDGNWGTIDDEWWLIVVCVACFVCVCVCAVCLCLFVCLLVLFVLFVCLFVCLFCLFVLFVWLIWIYPKPANFFGARPFRRPKSYCVVLIYVLVMFCIKYWFHLVFSSHGGNILDSRYFFCLKWCVEGQALIEICFVICIEILNVIWITLVGFFFFLMGRVLCFRLNDIHLFPIQSFTPTTPTTFLYSLFPFDTIIIEIDSFCSNK